MKKYKYVIIAAACVCLICGGFYLFAQSNPVDPETKLTEVQKVLAKDLSKDYPKTPREVVKFYNRIVESYHDDETSKEQIEDLASQMLFLFDDELAMINPKEEYYNAVLAEVEEYDLKKRSIANSEVCDSNDVKYVDDKKEGTDNVDKLAYVNTSYFVNTNGNFGYTYQQFVLRQDDNGKWKILVFYEIEGEESGDE